MVLVEGRKGDGVELEEGESVVFCTVSTSLFTALEPPAELCNLLESSRRTQRGQRRDINTERKNTEKSNIAHI